MNYLKGAFVEWDELKSFSVQNFEPLKQKSLRKEAFRYVFKFMS